MIASDEVRSRDMLAALDSLGDDELRMIIAHAQGLLLDRPGSPDVMPALAVELVGREEGRLLAAYRALAPLRQRRLLSHVVRLVRAPHQLARRQKASVATLTGAMMRRGHSALP